MEKFRYLYGIIASHKDQTVVGRTRLQKTVKLLQRVGLPTDYDFDLFFFGPYSEGVKSDIGLLEILGLVEEEEHMSQSGNPYYTIKAKTVVDVDALQPFEGYIKLMEKVDPVALELAATYDTFREMGSDNQDALERLRRKKGEKCTDANLREALTLLERLALPNR